MGMNVNPMQLVQLIKNGQNPQQLLMGILQQGNNNPILNNAMNLAKKGNIGGLQLLARNLAAQKGLDYDKAFEEFKNQFQ